MRTLVGNLGLTTQMSKAIPEAWVTFTAGWPPESGMFWQAELGLITRRHLYVTVSDSCGPTFGDRVLLLEGHP